MKGGSISVLLSLMIAVATSATADETSFKITTKRDNDKVEVKIKGDKAAVSIHSPFGISNTLIERTCEKWPEVMILRLHLKGLESFEVSNGKVTIEASRSSQDGQVRLWMDGKEDSPLDSKSPYWTELRIVGKDEKTETKIPLEDGYFEIQLPRALFEDNPKSITVNWTDFYR